MIRFRLIKLRIALLVAVLVTTLAANRISFGRPAVSQNQGNFDFTAPPPVVISTYLVGDARDVFRSINFKRKENGLDPLVWDERLADLALSYSKQMAQEDFFSHFDPAGRTIVERAEEFEINDWLKIGENLYKSKGYLVPTDLAVDGWMKSDSHRGNIVDPDWTHTGIGVFQTSDSETFITQAFMKKS